jgi:hypothetical protein
MTGRLTTFVNQTEMVSLSGLARTIGWFVAVVVFTFAACFLLILGGLHAVREGKGNEALTIGLQVTIAVLGGLFAASGVGAVNTHTIRTTAREFKEAEQRGKASATPPAATVHAEKVEKVEVSGRTE